MSAPPQVTDFLSLPEFMAADLPTEDRFIFGSLSTSELLARADVCENRYRQRISELEAYIATVRSLRNYCSPISRLPNEILAHVFADSSLTLETHIRRVCRRWRSILLACTRFWANCVSSSEFDASLHDNAFLRVALKHSSALSISISIQDTDPVSSPTVWNTLLEHHTRITELTVDTSEVEDEISLGLDYLFRFGRMEKLQSLNLLGDSDLLGKPDEPYTVLRRADWNQANLPALRTLGVTAGGMSPYMVVASLTTLSIERVRLPLTVFIDVLNKCPLLESLQVGWRTLDDDDIIRDDRGICLPQLREVTIDETPYNILALLGLFKSQPISTRTLLTLSSPTRKFPPISYPQLFALPQIHRMCFEPSGSPNYTITARAFSGFNERLRILIEELDDIEEFLIPTISVFIVSSPVKYCDRACIRAIEDWDLPRLQRLEIFHMSTPSNKQELAWAFLSCFGSRASELSLAWVLPIDSEQETQSLAEAELQDLVVDLRDHVNRENPRLGRLELYAIERAEWEPFDGGSIEAGSDTRLCSKIVEPFLTELKKWVDVVHVG